MTGVRDVSAKCPQAVRGADTSAPATPHVDANSAVCAPRLPPLYECRESRRLTCLAVVWGGAGTGSVAEELVMVERRSCR
jgi:hypothetical protein